MYQVLANGLDRITANGMSKKIGTVAPETTADLTGSAAKRTRLSPMFSHLLAATLLLALGFLNLSGCNQSESEASDSRLSATQSPEKDQSLRDAAFAGRIAEARRALDQGAGVNGADEENRTALMLAAFNDSADVAKLLLDRGARVDDRDNAGRTALLYAASGPNAKTVQLLLGQGADVNATDEEEGWTALMFAAAEGHAAVVRALLSHGADPSIQDADSETALDFATDKGHAGVIQVLKGGP